MDEPPKRLPWAWILGLTALAYLPILAGRFNFDDVCTVLQNRSLGSWHALLLSFRAWTGRPLFWLTLNVDHGLWGTDPVGYHATGLALHLAATALLAALARDLLGRRAGISAGLLFGLHPLASSAVCYISERADVLAAAFCLAALHALHRGSLWGASGAWALALLSKESAIGLPACALALTPLLKPEHAARARIWGLAGCLLALIAFSLIVPGMKLPDDVLPHGAYAQAGVGAMGRYLRLWVLPFGQSADADLASSSLPAALALPAVLLASRRLSLAAGCAVLAALLAVLPVSSVLPLLDPVQENRAYLACAFLALGTASLAPSPGVLAALALCGALLTSARARAWGSETGLWQRDLRTCPRKIRIYANLARRYGQAAAASRSTPLFDATERMIRNAIRIREVPGQHYDLAMIALDRRDAPAARRELERALALSPGNRRYLEVLRRLDAAGFR